MNINLNIDIPKEYNDMSQGELAQLSVNIKKLVADINYAFSQLDEENLSKRFKQRLDDVQKTAENTKKAYDDYIAMQNKCKFHVSLQDGKRVFNVSDYTSASVSGKAILIIPDVESDIKFKQRVIYIAEIDETEVTMAWSNKDYSSMPDIGFTVMLI